MKEDSPKCLEIGESPGDWDKFRIVFSTDKLYMKKEKDDTLGHDFKTIEGFTPCFYYCEKGDECELHYNEEFFINKDKNFAPFLHVKNKDHICLFELKGGWIGEANVEALKKKYC